MKKAPGRTPGLFLFDAFCRSEPVIETRAHDVGAEARVGPGDRAAVAEIDIEIFDLGGPRSSNRRFEAAADGPAHFGVARVSTLPYCLAPNLPPTSTASAPLN